MKRIIIGSVALFIISVFGYLARNDFYAITLVVYFIFWYLLLGSIIISGWLSYIRNKKQV